MTTTETTGQPTASASTTSAPAPSSTAVAERPSTWDEAYAQAEAAETAAPATPDDATSADPASADAIAPPAQTPDQQVTAPEPKGPIPFVRHEAAVKNARAEGRSEGERAVRQQYENHIGWGEAVQRDPRNLFPLVMDALRDPTHGAEMRAELARVFGGLRRPAAPTPEAEPQPDLQTSDGELVYSAKQQKLWQQWSNRQLAQQIKGEFAPLVQDHQTRQQHAKLEQLWTHVESDTRRLFDSYKDAPGFQENLKDIATYFKTLTEPDARGVPKMDYREGIWLAYQRVLKEKVLPGTRAQSQHDLVAQAAAKAAGRDHNPAAVAPSPPRRPKTWDEAYQQVGLE